MKKLIKLKLKILSGLILKKYQPKVIAVTGSIGKTGSREAVYTVLSGKYTVRRSCKDKSSDLEVFLTIIGFAGGDRGLTSLTQAVFKAVSILIFKDNDYPQILILEINADKQGTINKMLKNIKPYIGIITFAGRIYSDYFKNIEEATKEKSMLFSALNKNDWAVFNADDKNILKFKKNIKAQTLSYGFNKSCDITANNIRFTYVEDDDDIENLRGLSLKINYQGATVPIFLPNSLSIGQVYAALSAIAVGIIYGLNLVEIAERLRVFETPKGRSVLLSGIKESVIIDDSYEAFLESVEASLDVLTKIPIKKSHRRIAVIGDMSAPGADIIKNHQIIGKKIAALEVDLLFLVGEKSRDIARAAKKAGMKENSIKHYAFAKMAGEDIKNIIKSGDLILVSGSSKVKMETVVKNIMANPEKAK